MMPKKEDDTYSYSSLKKAFKALSYQCRREFIDVLIIIYGFKKRDIYRLMDRLEKKTFENSATWIMKRELFLIHTTNVKDRSYEH